MKIVRIKTTKILDERDEEYLMLLNKEPALTVDSIAK